MAVLRRMLLPFAKRFVAGETVDSAIDHTKDLNRDGIAALVDLLGEHVEDRETVLAAQEEYIELLDRMDAETLDGGLSIKPTHLGLEIDTDFCRGRVRELVKDARERGQFVWLDMESTTHTQDTIDLYTGLRETFDDVGICIQSYLKRSQNDVDRLLERNGIIRLVKGAYNEPAADAYQSKTRVNASFRALAATLFDEAEYFAIATHDTDLVAYAKELAERHNRGPDAFEFQFLMGVKTKLQRELAADGYTVAQYVPYGPEWLAYYWRRVRERRENLFFAAQALLGR